MSRGEPKPLSTDQPTSDVEDPEVSRPHGPGAKRKEKCCECCTYLRFVKAMKWIGILSCIGVGCLSLLSFSEAVSPSSVTTTDDQGTTVTVPGESVWSVSGITNIVFLFFQLALTLLLFLGFFELGFVLTYFPVFEGWVGLGLMMIYLSVAALMNLNCTEKYRNNPGAMSVCFILAAEGLFFTLAGCCGGKKITQR